MSSQLPIFSLRLQPEMLERLKKHAEQRRRSVTSLITEVIEDALDHMDHLDEVARTHGRSEAAALSDLSDDQFDELLSVIEGIRAKARTASKRKR